MMTGSFRLVYILLLAGLIFTVKSLSGQGSFTELVDRALGSNQELVNGIQFTNQYIRAEGHPYWIDGGFKTGSACINDQWFDDLQLRYNVYTQKLELGYLTPEGFMNLIITVPENISAFYLGGYIFKRMQFGEDMASYYQVFSKGRYNFYIRWSKKLLGGESTGSRFDALAREYWMQEGENLGHFRGKQGYLAAFPKEKKKDLKQLLNQLNFSFKNATSEEMLSMLEASVLLLEEGGEP